MDPGSGSRQALSASSRLERGQRAPGSLIPFILINMTTADTTLLSTHNTQKWGLSSFQGDKSGEWGFPNGGRGVWGLLTSGAGVMEPHPLVAMVSRFPIIQDSCPVPI